MCYINPHTLLFFSDLFINTANLYSTRTFSEKASEEKQQNVVSSSSSRKKAMLPCSALTASAAEGCRQCRTAWNTIIQAHRNKCRGIFLASTDNSVSEVGNRQLGRLRWCDQTLLGYCLPAHQVPRWAYVPDRWQDRLVLNSDSVYSSLQTQPQHLGLGWVES